MAGFARIAPSPTSVVVVKPTATSWETVPEKKRVVATAKVVVIKAVIKNQVEGVSLRTAIEHFIIKCRHNLLPPLLTKTAISLGRNGKPPSRSTIYNWVKNYEEKGVMGLIKNHKGSERIIYGWEAAALRYYSLPSKPGMDTVAIWLRREGHDSATNNRVRAYIKSMPADLGKNSRGRMGAKLFCDTHKQHVHRNTDVIPVGFIYQGDGHTVDAYVAHPQTGETWRPELTVWIDIGSRFIVGWFVTESESALSTMFSLSHALTSWDHVPAMLHIDNGAGFKSKMVNDESVGFYARLNIEPMFSIPGNAKGKGQVERWFRTMRDQFDKRWDTYCGHDMSADALKKVLSDVNKGKRELPSQKEYIDELTIFINDYNNTVHSALDGKTPAELWTTLERTPLEMPAAAICLPQKEVSVRRQAIRFDKRDYMAPELIQYNGERLIVEYSVHDDERVRVLLKDGRWVCDATLVKKADYLPASRIDEAQVKRLNGQQKRLQKKMDENEKRLHNNITHDQVLTKIDNFSHEISQPKPLSIEQLDSEKIDLISPAIEKEKELIEEERINLDLTEF